LRLASFGQIYIDIHQENLI